MVVDHVMCAWQLFLGLTRGHVMWYDEIGSMMRKVEVQDD